MGERGWTWACTRRRRAWSADMTTREGAPSIVRAAREHFGDPDVLVAFLTGETIRLDGGFAKSLF